MPPTRSPSGATAPDDGVRFATRVLGLTHISVRLLPSSEVGPEPLDIPCSGHNVYVDLMANGMVPVVLRALRAEVVSREEFRPDGVVVAPLPGPSISFAEDLADARRRGLENYQPMLMPDHEILLDETPPVVRTAVGNTGHPLNPSSALPLTVPVGETRRVVVAPHTEDRRLLTWRLTAEVTYAGSHAKPAWTLKTTAETTMRVFAPDDPEGRFSPAHDASDHWAPVDRRRR
ncbi:hypothetical protein ACIQCF_39235 [Streptomyces sp. NPDC088353]|uniref:hypothetical protein n=1 Tax=Streptomyces sp. NPDC088353 TaxID=3365855 RepID=UPI0037FCD22E